MQARRQDGGVTEIRYWTTEWIIDACQEWERLHGVPPRGEDWERNPGWPSKTVCRIRFGSWNAMIEAAGFQPRDSSMASLVWTREATIEACQRWAAEHGRPPVAKEWVKAVPERPLTRSVLVRFGTWNQMIEASGFEPRPAHSPARWTRDMVADAMLDWLLAHGKWPTRREWSRGHGGRYPCVRTVDRLFGRWNLAKTYAGWDPLASSRPAPRSVECSGCGGELDNVTAGCDACNDRMRKRALWANDADYREQQKQARRERHARKLAA